MDFFIQATTPVTDGVLKVIAHLPTTSLSVIVAPGFWPRLDNAAVMRIAFFLAQKSYDEGGCPIGGVIVDNQTRFIIGKGHNRLVQDNDPYHHGETAAIRDAGRQDFSRTTLFTTLSPCAICASLCIMRGFSAIVIGDITNASGNEALLQAENIQVTECEDARAVALYAKYRKERPELDVEDWRGVAGLK